ncbi:MAG: hypothetical protein ACRDPT_13765 [Streptomycetales bacterium]
MYQGPVGADPVETLVTVDINPVVIESRGPESVVLRVTEQGPALADDQSRTESRASWATVLGDLAEAFQVMPGQS